MLIVTGKSRYFRKPELFVNGGLESATTGYSTNGTPTITHVADPRTGSLGSNCANIVRGTQSFCLYQDFTLEVGRSYTFKFWYKHDTANFCGWGHYKDGWTLVTYVNNLAATDWTEVTATIIPTSATNRIGVIVEDAKGEIGKFDDLSLRLT